MVEWQEGHPACKNPVLLILKESSSGTDGGGRPKGNWLTQVRLKNDR